MPLSVDECAAEFRSCAAEGTPRTAVPLCPVFRGRWCLEHEHAFLSAGTIKDHVREHNNLAPGFTEESMEETFFVKLSERPGTYELHTVRVRLGCGGGFGLLVDWLVGLAGGLVGWFS